MIYKNIELHNIARVLPSENGVLLDRVPKSVFDQLDEPATHTSNNDAGVELRFVMQSSTVKITLRTQVIQEPQIAYVQYGNFGAEWAQAAYILQPKGSTIVLRRPQNLPHLQALAKKLGQPFDPAVVRICLPYCRNWLIDVEGAVTPPTKAQLPAQTYLAYGSSITHGTLALSPQHTYAALVAKQLKMDLRNWGFAGSAWLEPAVADYLAAQTDWQVATIAMGINMLDEFSVDEFRQRVRRFVAPFAADSRKVLATDMVLTDYPKNPDKPAAFRQVVKEETAGKLPYINGLDLLDDWNGLSADLLHPNAWGMQQIAEHFSARMQAL